MAASDSSESNRQTSLTRRVREGVARVRQQLRDVDALRTDALRDRLRPYALDPAALRDRLDRIDVAFIEAGADDTTTADVERVVDRADDIEARFHGDGPLGRLLEDGKLMLSLVQDYWGGRYRAVPRWTLTASAFALLYVLNPLDLVPDALPVIGVIDDAAVLSLTLVLFEQDLREYRTWLKEKEREVSES